LTSEILLLAGTAATIGLLHTILGPDHYLPFIILSKARKWGVTKTTLITLLCGLGHISGSVILGLLGVALGVAIFSIQAIESFRGEIAIWFLIAFGFTYMVWGIHRAFQSKRHEHQHIHLNEGEHSHAHNHVTDHLHIHTDNYKSLTPWILFIIFIFGPCEPLIPLIIYPAAEHNMMSVALVTIAFGLTTIITMLTMVLASYYGLSKISLPKMARFSHALAGLAIVICGGAVKLLGL
jgi:nickel/cobalt transporter (NicO) family protein